MPTRLLLSLSICFCVAIGHAADAPLVRRRMLRRGMTNCLRLSESRAMVRWSSNPALAISGDEDASRRHRQQARGVAKESERRVGVEVYWISSLTY